MSDTGTTTRPRRPSEETARLGDETYERDIRSLVEADHHGEVVAIDVNSGSWAVGDDVIAATDRLQTKRPDAIDVWLLRVGHRALHHFGGRPLGTDTTPLVGMRLLDNHNLYVEVVDGGRVVIQAGE